jgi:hypothetical protein
MSFADFLRRLKALLNVEINFDFSQLKQIVNIQIINKSNVDSKVSVNSDTPAIEVNIAQLNPKEKTELQGLLRGAYEEWGHLLKDQDCEIIQDFKQKENLPEVREQLAYFRPKVLPGDIPILRACLYLKASYEQGQSVAPLKAKIVDAYGTRGRNIANLCSAGYFDDWLKPLYELLRENEEDEATALERFRGIYNTIVEELPWTVFVSRNTPKAEIQEEILRKLKANLRYGIRWINIHALSEPNVAKIRAVLPIVEQKYPGIRRSIAEEGSRIYVKLEVMRSLGPGESGPPSDQD